jgi:hypothetical protein
VTPVTQDCTRLFGYLSENLGDDFYVMSLKNSYDQLKFKSYIFNERNFPSINYRSETDDLSLHECLSAKINKTTNKLDFFATHCTGKKNIFCQKVLFVKPNCSEKLHFKNQSWISILLNSSLKLKYEQSIAYQKAEIMDMIKRIDMEKAYQSIFKSLWYSYLPCYDVKNISSTFREMSLIKYCEWKGIQIPCSEVFTSFPTDEGLCCSFNMKAADEIYKESIFRDTLQAMQRSDKVNSYSTQNLFSTDVIINEPEVGIKKGLTVLLDSHSNLLHLGSYDEDFHDFTTIIQSGGSFPLMNQKGLILRPGHNNLITLTSSIIQADENVRNLYKEDRNCLFPDENSNLTLHKKYSYANCKFECSLGYAKEKVFKMHGKKCQPWFFPVLNDSSTICDPWISNKFFQLMNDEISDSLCSHCLPDCSFTFYEPSVVAVPFKQCDASNFGVSQFCQFKTSQPLIDSVLLQTIREYPDPNNYFRYDPPNYIQTMAEQERFLASDIFNKSPVFYSAFSQDIAMVQIIYQKSTLVKIQTQLTMNWIDYFSMVGGLFGLVLGMGFYSLFDIIWLFIRITFKNFDSTRWIA